MMSFRRGAISGTCSLVGGWLGTGVAAYYLSNNIPTSMDYQGMMTGVAALSISFGGNVVGWYAGRAIDTGLNYYTKKITKC